MVGNCFFMQVLRHQVEAFARRERRFPLFSNTTDPGGDLQWQNALVSRFSFSLILFLCPLLIGQTTGSISGTVTDKTGSVISGASVTVTSQATGVVREAKTDGSGHYVLTLLPVSIYTIAVESQGFQTSQQKNVKLQTDEQLEVNFTLVPGNVTEKN
jgi:hypothetical protein